MFFFRYCHARNVPMKRDVPMKRNIEKGDGLNERVPPLKKLDPLLIRKKVLRKKQRRYGGDF